MNPIVLVIAAAAAAAASAAAPIDPGKVVDLTHTLRESTPHWPGGRYHPFRPEVIATLEENGVFSRTYCTPEHLGTHVDAPNHFEAGQPALDAIAIEDLIAPAVVIDISARASKDHDAALSIDEVRDWEKRHGAVPPGSIVLLRTGWGDRAGDAAAFRNQDESGRMHFPGFGVEAARYLIGERKARALGIDTLSIDPGLSADFAVHHVLNGAGRYGIEGMARLEKLPPIGSVLIVAPVKIGGGTGGQARIFAILP